MLSLGGEWGAQGSVWMGNEGLGINLGEGVSQGSVWMGDGELRAKSGWGLGGLRPQFGWGEGTQGSVLGYVGAHNSVLWSVGDSRLNLREVLMFVRLSQGKASTTEMFSPFDAMNTNFHKY